MRIEGQLERSETRKHRGTARGGPESTDQVSGQVTGLCKLATLEEVKEQDYSLNPGRYVGVVIEEDGKTEEEFIEDILSLNAELLELNKQAGTLESVIAHNVKQLTGDNS